MPDKGTHKRQAEHNQQFVDYFDLTTTPYLDWAVTGIFYSALHYVEGYLATVNTHTLSHKKREPYFSRMPVLKAIWKPYRKLKTKSEAGRYWAKSFQVLEVQNLIVQEYSDIKNQIIGYL